MNPILRLLLWLCGYGSHTFFYLFAFLLAPVGIAACATGNWKLTKVFIILAICTVLLFVICSALYVFGLA